MVVNWAQANHCLFVKPLISDNLNHWKNGWLNQQWSITTVVF